MPKKGISGSTLKIIAVIAMILDHTAWALLDPTLAKQGMKINGIYSPLSQLSVSPVLGIISPVLHTIGRVTFPIMLFLLVEGFTHTKSLKKYIRNMAVFALVSEIPFNLAFKKHLYAPAGVFHIDGQNVFITLTLGLLALTAIETIKEKAVITKELKFLCVFLSFFSAAAFSWFFVKKILAVFGYKVNYFIVGVVTVIAFTALALTGRKKDSEERAILSLSLFIVAVASLISYALSSDYSFMGVTALYVMYSLRNDKIASYTAGTAYLTAHTYTEAGAFLALPLISAYNGKRGLKLKYLFYIAYPAHLLILYAIRMIIKV